MQAPCLQQPDDLDIHYEGVSGEIIDGLVLPALRRSVRYDRLTSFFSTSALVAIAVGLDELHARGGTMRLVIGVHDVPRDLAEARARTDGWADDVVSAVRRRVLAEVSDLRQELSRDRLATLAWMMQDGLLQVRVAVPIHVGGGSSIFHSKRLLFTDDDGHVVSAVGSANETPPGQEGNYEELTVMRSWRDAGHVERHEASFETIWRSQRPDLITRQLDARFARELLDALDERGRPSLRPSSEDRTGAVLAAARDSPALGPLNSGPVALYPHQERAVLDALSRSPVRVLLADEVGLGKTLEAGAIISYLVRFGGIDDVTVLAPANVLRQWREELELHFGLSFWTYDPAHRRYETADGRAVPAAGGPLDETRPSLTLVSAQLARGNRAAGHIFAEGRRLPQLLLVDEAHAARVKPDQQGRRRPTLLWRAIDDIARRIPHLVLMTATPMQLHPGEYHALLQLLGLPDGWSELSAYERSLELLARGRAAQPRMQSGLDAVELIGEALRTYHLTLPGDLELPDTFAQLSSDEAAGRRLARPAVERWSQTYDLLAATHPAHLLTIRNSRSGLEQLGYRFPVRKLEAPELDVPQSVGNLYERVNDYLRSGYGKVEESLDPQAGRSHGFARSSYHQRLVSTLEACRSSLTRRLERLEALLDTEDATAFREDEEGDLTDDLDVEPLPPAELGASGRGTTNPALSRAVSIERADLMDLLRRLDDLAVDGELPDPKLMMLLELLDAHAGTDRVLVFSRYTDSLRGALHAFEQHHPTSRPGYALYTGSEAWIDIGERRTATKEDVRAALDAGDVEVVFCSDAASEGLNLQSARVIVNIDVPWNPARLEQRIGRVARLGQQAEEVVVYNLWYPGSVEQRIYARLFLRRDLYQLAVGEFPELIARTIQEALAASFDPDAFIAPADPLDELQGLREAHQHLTTQVWDRAREPVPGSEQLRTELLAILAESLEAPPEALDLDAGSRNPLTLLHRSFDLLRDRPAGGSPCGLLSSVQTGGSPIGFCVESDGRRWAIPMDRLPELLAATSLARPLTLPADDPPIDGDAALENRLRARSRWLPDPTRMRTVGPTHAGLDGEVGLTTIGTIPIEVL